MNDSATTEIQTEVSTNNRRQHDRIMGPFDGVRLGTLETALRIFDLSSGGCFVNSMHEQTPGITFMMKLELPKVDPIEVKVQTLYSRSGFGFAVRFVDMDEETKIRLEHALEQQQEQARQPEGSVSFQPSPLVVPLSASLRSAEADTMFRNLPVRSRPAFAIAADRPRADRVGMLGSGYQVHVDGHPVALVNLSLSGVQIRGPIRLLPDQPSIVKIGWPQDDMSCAAIARVRWVQAESEPSRAEEVYRAGLVFETWDVQRLKKIMQHRGRSAAAPRPDTKYAW